jgi:hypothetical protein
MTALVFGAVLVCSCLLSSWLTHSLLLPSFKEARKKSYGYTSIWRRGVYFREDVRLSDSYMLATGLKWLGLIVSPIVGLLAAYLTYKLTLPTQSLWFAASLASGCFVAGLFCSICACTGRGILHPLWTEAQAEKHSAFPKCPECHELLVTGGCPYSKCSNYLFREQVRRESKPIYLGTLFGMPFYRCPDKVGRISDKYRAQARRLVKERDKQIRRAR